jgi:glycosyltransferase involved in cell wall biosynthesis
VQTLVVIPTYQEARNIGEVVRRVRSAAPDVDVLIVDDDSPDGTAAEAESVGAELARCRSSVGPGAAGWPRRIVPLSDGVYSAAMKSWSKLTATCPMIRIPFRSYWRQLPKEPIWSSQPATWQEDRCPQRDLGTEG